VNPFLGTRPLPRTRTCIARQPNLIPLQKDHEPLIMFTPSQSYHYIEEYTALWTAQKHQKAKRWQDGHLRLHTFNSRLFLTDSTGTAVSDKYYLSSRTPIYIENDKAGQSRGSLECDTEIEFEQHLVQVLDFLGWRKGEA